MYEFAGGDQAFLTLAAAHRERCLADPELTCLPVPRWSWNGLQ